MAALAIEAIKSECADWWSRRLGGRAARATRSREGSHTRRGSRRRTARNRRL